MSTGELSSYDIHTTCRLAQWADRKSGGLTYAIEGLKPCVVISHLEEPQYSWQYEVNCYVSKQLFRSRKHNRADCIEEAGHWLGIVKCPGHVLQKG